MASTYNIANLFTNVDLARYLTENLVEKELALLKNPGQFSSVILFDQANGVDNNLAFPTGWNGADSYYTSGFSQDIWKETGIAIVQPSKIANEKLNTIYEEAIKKPSSYANDLTQLIFSTGSTKSSQNISPVINVGVTTKFDILPEMQTGSPVAVDYLLDQSNSSIFFNKKPHAIWLSNHGGSFINGSNGDGPSTDLDQNYTNLEVVDFKNSLFKSISNSAQESRFGLVTYDECLMANVELATELSGVTRYILASQEIVPGYGFDYLLTLSDFKTNSKLESQSDIELTSKRLGEAFVSTFNGRNGNFYTISLTDTNGILDLNIAIKTYVDELLKSNDKLLNNLLDTLRLKGTSYEYKFLQDLGNLALISKNLQGASTALINASQEILVKLDKAVVVNNQGYRPIEDGFIEKNSSGLTITLPTNYDQYVELGTSANFKIKAPAFEAQTGWSVLLERISKLLQMVETNTASADQSDKKLRYSGEIIKSPSNEAWFALEINGYLCEFSSNPIINSSSFTLPELKTAKASDLILYLDILNLENPGIIILEFQDINGNIKGTLSKQIDNYDVLLFDFSELESEDTLLEFANGDKIVLIPSGGLDISYDLDMMVADHDLQEFGESDINGISAKFNTPILLNTSLIANRDQKFLFSTPILPQELGNEEQLFHTDVVLLSEFPGSFRVSFEEPGGASVAFESMDYIDELISLKPSTEYILTVSYQESEEIYSNIDSEKLSSPSSDVALYLNYTVNPQIDLDDALLTKNSQIIDWGKYSVESNLTNKSSIVKTEMSRPITTLQDLTEGTSIHANISSFQVDKNSTFKASTDGGTETYFSGLWTSAEDLKIRMHVEGRSANSASFAFYKVDSLTGAILTSNGLVNPKDRKDYFEAAKNNLVSPLVDFDGFNKNGDILVNVEKGQSYAALLITHSPDGMQTPLYSILDANINSSVQCISFGSGLYGFEDLINSQGINSDNDFNDLIFYTER